MTGKRVAAIAASVVGLLVLGEVAARALAPREPGFAIKPEVHPLIGEAPQGSFAKAPDGPELQDFAGRKFPLAKSPDTFRVLLLGGTRAAAAGLPAALATSLEKVAKGKKVEVVQGARDGFLPVQDLFVYAGFARGWQLDAVVVADGLEVETRPPPFPGWTPAWTRHRRALEHPVVAALCERSRLFAVVVGERILGPDREPPRAATPDDVERAARDARSLAVIAAADKVPLAWVTVADGESKLAPEKAKKGRVAGKATDAEVGEAAAKALGE